MAKRFGGKIAVVTGGSAGIGLATAKRFVEEGMDHVFITGRRRDTLEAATAEIGKKVTGVQGDVAKLAKYHRPIGIILANAGLAKLAVFGAVEKELFDLLFDANVKGMFFAVQKGLRLMRGGGSIILHGSITDTKGFPAMSVSSATKAAVRSFATTLTNDLRDRRIRGNALSPGHIDTPILEDLQQSEALTKMKKDMANNVPLGRLGGPRRDRRP